MKLRTTLILTAIVSSILGALVVYLVLSVPKDLRADALLKQARQAIAEGHADQARPALLQIVQRYPRTDAAAAAMVVLLAIEKRERAELTGKMAAMHLQNARQARQSAQQAKLLADLQKSLADLASAPPKVVTVQAPPPKPPPQKKTAPKKKTTPPKKSTRRSR